MLKKSILTLLLMISFPSVAFSISTLKYAYEDKEIFPFYMGKGREIPNNPGITIEKALMLEAIVPIKIILVRMPWKRCLQSLKIGEVDAVVASFKTDRLQMGLYPMKNHSPDPSRRFAASRYFLYKHKDSPITWDEHNQTIHHAKLSIGAPLGYSIITTLKKMGVTIEEYGTGRDNLDKLRVKHIDGAALLEMDTDYLLQSEPERYQGIVKMSPPLQCKPYYLVLSHQFTRKHPELSQKIWNALPQLRENSKDLVQKYFKMKPNQ